MFVFTLAAMLIAAVSASSHSEAPGTARGPRTDLADLYAFQAAPSDVQRTTIIVNANGLARSDGGPNYNPTDANFVYQINIDNNGDAEDDITFQFIFGQRFGDAANTQGAGVALNIGGLNVKIPLVVFSPATATGGNKVNLFQPFLNNLEYFRVRAKRGGNDEEPLENGPFLSAFDSPSATTFIRPFEHVGQRTFSVNSLTYDDYVEQFTYTVGNNARYANGHQSDDGVRIPGCDQRAQLFVGPRRESFSIDLGRVFDLLNFNPLEDAQTNPPDVRFNTLDCNSVLTFALDIPTSCLVTADNKVLGIYASVRELEHVERKSGSYHVTGKQTNRLGNPLINELFIGLPDKDLWSTTDPSEDSQFTPYLNFPTFPKIVESVLELINFNVGGNFVRAPFVDAAARPPIGRFDLVQTLHIGLPGLNLPTRVADSSSSSSSSKRKRSSSSSSSSSSTEESLAPVEADLLRLNTAIAPLPFSGQHSLAVLQGDVDGFPNGRRLGDDVVDIYVRAAMGQLCSQAFVDFITAGVALLPGLAGTRDALVANCPRIGPSPVPQANSIPYAVTFGLPLHDRAPIGATGFDEDFPHLNPPIEGNLLLECYIAIDDASNVNLLRKRSVEEQKRWKAEPPGLPQFSEQFIHCGPALQSPFTILSPLTPPSCTQYWYSK